MAGSWDDRAYLRGAQYTTDANLAARQSVYVYQAPHVDLAARVVDLAGPAPSETIADVGCGNGMYLAELARRGLPCRVLGVDLSLGMLAAARERLAAVPGTGPASPNPSASPPAPTAAGPSGPSGPSGPPEPPARVTLAAGDATALPLRDDTADLTLAAHMLYHVPEPADALREFRRVTRPGGRVVIVLNGAGHLRQLRAAIAAVLGGAAGAGATVTRERVTLDDGESLARSFFGQVTRHDFPAELRVPEPGPIADYVRSLPGALHGAPRGAGRADLAAAVVAALPRTPEGHYVITTHAGCLVCRVN